MDIIKFLIVAFMAASFRVGVNTDLIPFEQQQEYIEQYVFEIIEEGNYDVNPAYILAIIYKESRGVWTAKNGDHYGLMQINPKWQQERMERLNVTDLAANPYDNLKVGIDFFDQLLKDYPNPYDALNVYNSGSTDGLAHAYSLTVMDKKYEIEHELWDKYEGW